MEHINLFLPKKLLEALLAHAQAHERTVSGVIRQAISEYLARQVRGR